MYTFKHWGAFLVEDTIPKCTCVYIHVHVYIYMYMCICTRTCTYMYLHVCTPVHFALPSEVYRVLALATICIICIHFVHYRV